MEKCFVPTNFRFCVFFQFPPEVSAGDRYDEGRANWYILLQNARNLCHGMTPVSMADLCVSPDSPEIISNNSHGGHSRWDIGMQHTRDRLETD